MKEQKQDEEMKEQKQGYGMLRRDPSTGPEEKVALCVNTYSSATTATSDKVLTFCSLRYTTMRSGKHFLKSSIRINSLNELKSLTLQVVPHLSKRTPFSLANST